MSRLAKNLRAASNAADAPVYVDDVFSMLTYEGTSPTVPSKTVTNGINLARDGGFVWAKARISTTGQDHALCDTERGALQVLKPSNTIAEATSSGSVTSFNSDGFTLGTSNNDWNSNLRRYVAYTFKKQSKFLDIVTWTGDDASSRTISHNLGQQPGMIWVKNRDRSGAGGSWVVYHASAGFNLILNDTNQEGSTELNYGRISGVSNSDFTVASGSTNNDSVNVLNERYIAYVFGGAQAQNFGPNQDQDIIKVGAYNGTGNADGPTVNLGFEPQLLIIKSRSNGQWYLLDTARQNMSYKGTNFTENNDYALWVNSNVPETSTGPDNHVLITPTGFKACSTSSTNISGQAYIYFAIRRPMKPPTSINGYFDIDRGSFSGDPNFSMSSGAPDFAMLRESISSNGNFRVGTRYLWEQYLQLNGNASALSSGAYNFDYENSWYNATTNTDSYSWMWARGSEFFDVSTYEANGGALSIPHNLGVAPEMMIVKRLDSNANWATYHSTLGPTAYDVFDSNQSYVTSSAAWNDTAPTEDYFYIGNGSLVNNGRFIALLFATKAGMSKVGEYVGTGSVAQNIDCGFSNGARFIIIKHFDSVSLGAWWLFDTERGITVSSSPYLQPGLSVSENNGGVAPNWVTPYSGGFGLTNNAPNVNQIGLTYSFYAVAAP